MYRKDLGQLQAGIKQPTPALSCVVLSVTGSRYGLFF